MLKCAARLDKLVSKLTSLNPLRPEEIASIEALPVRLQTARARTTIVAEGQRVVECVLLVDGFACRHKVARDGGRQIVSFHMPGDILDIQHLLFDRADHNVQAITDATLAFIPMTALRDLIDMWPEVARGLWRDCLVDASVFREWVLNVGRRSAKTRIAHMLCEFAARAEASGIGSPAHFSLPMTQEDIADATGLTAVHVNRMLRELSEDGVIEREGRQIRIADWPRMQRIADFSPAYLHLAA